jgi:E3 ubiquitin-protein ligase synoviolin
MVKFYQYFLTSLLLSASMIAYACFTREQFYPIILLLVTSKVSFVIGANMILATFILTGKIGIRLFFKELRDAELEIIREQTKYSVTETLLALTTFRNELTPTVFLFFGILVFFKIFHWIARSRLDYLEQVARVTLYQHSTLLMAIVLMLLSCVVISYCCVVYSITEGKTVIILFAFEFGVLSLSSICNFVRYVINVIDGYYENGLQFKGLYFMILDLIYDGLRFCTYVGFFCIVFVYYGLPIHIVRDVYMAFISFFMRLTSFVRYMKLTRNLDARLEDATAEDLAAHEDGGCLICREGMDSGKKLACGHVFHLNCLRTWLQHQQTCPLCRADIEVSSTDGPGGERHRREQRALAAAVAAAERVRGQAEVPAQAQAQGQLFGDENLVRQVHRHVEEGNVERMLQQDLDQYQEGGLRRRHVQQERQGEEVRGEHQDRQMPVAIPRVTTTAPSSSAAGSASRSLLAKPAVSSSVSSSSIKTHSVALPCTHGARTVPQNAFSSTQHDVPGFYVTEYVVTVHQTSQINSPVLRTLPVGVIVFVECRANEWLKLPDGWVVGFDGVKVNLRPYVDTAMSNVTERLKDMQSRKSVCISSPLRSSTIAPSESSPARVLRILRMQQDMSRLQRSLQVVQEAMGRLSHDLAETLQDEIVLQAEAPSTNAAYDKTRAQGDDSKKVGKSTVESDKQGINTKIERSVENSTKSAFNSASDKTRAQVLQGDDNTKTSVESDKQGTNTKIERSVENSSVSAFNVPVATRSASTPSRLPGSSAFGHLTRRQVAITTPEGKKTQVMTTSEERRALPRDINRSDEKTIPGFDKQIKVEGIHSGGQVPGEEVNISSNLSPNSSLKSCSETSFHTSSPGGTSSTDVREMRAKRFGTSSAHPPKESEVSKSESES